jgi:hypothetical protein
MVVLPGLCVRVGSYAAGVAEGVWGVFGFEDHVGGSRVRVHSR